MLKRKLELEEETIQLVSQEINLGDEIKKEDQSIHDIYSLFAILLFISIVTWQSSSIYSLVNQVNWLLQQTDNPKCNQIDEISSIKDFTGSQRLECH